MYVCMYTYIYIYRDNVYTYSVHIYIHIYVYSFICIPALARSRGIVCSMGILQLNHSRHGFFTPSVNSNTFGFVMRPWLDKAAFAKVVHMWPEHFRTIIWIWMVLAFNYLQVECLITGVSSCFWWRWEESLWPFALKDNVFLLQWWRNNLVSNDWEMQNIRAERIQVMLPSLHIFRHFIIHGTYTYNMLQPSSWKFMAEAPRSGSQFFLIQVHGATGWDDLSYPQSPLVWPYVPTSTNMWFDSFDVEQEWYLGNNSFVPVTNGFGDPKC